MFFGGEFREGSFPGVAPFLECCADVFFTFLAEEGECWVVFSDGRFVLLLFPDPDVDSSGSEGAYEGGGYRVEYRMLREP